MSAVAGRYNYTWWHPDLSAVILFFADMDVAHTNGKEKKRNERS
jgi:hypothetical protein